MCVCHQHYDTSPEIYKSINRVFSEHLFRSLHTKLKGSWRDNSIECSLELFPLIKSQRAKSREMTERLGELSTTMDRIKCTQYRVEKSGFLGSYHLFLLSWYICQWIRKLKLSNSKIKASFIVLCMKYTFFDKSEHFYNL